jgi:hypothetical protein
MPSSWNGNGAPRIRETFSRIDLRLLKSKVGRKRLISLFDTHQFYATYTDEACTILSEDFLSKNRTPVGFDMARLTHDLTETAKLPATHATISKKRWRPTN